MSPRERQARTEDKRAMMPPWIRLGAFGAVLVLAVLAVYLGTIRFEFVTLGDRQYVTENTMVSGGLTAAGIAWALTTFRASDWHPMTRVSLMIDAEIRGLAPSVFHATNVLLHLANTLLLFHLLAAATRSHGRSVFVALCFAVHDPAIAEDLERARAAAR